MASRTAIDLRAVVLDWLEDMEDDEPREIADAMHEAGAIEADDLEDALYAALPSYISAVRGSLRRQVTDAMAPDDDEEEVEVDGEKVRVRSGKKVRSKWDYRRDFLSKTWESSEGTRIKLGNMTKDDVRAVVKHYRKLAAANNDMAKRFRALLEVFDHHEDAETVADLPEQEVREALPGV